MLFIKSNYDFHLKLKIIIVLLSNTFTSVSYCINQYTCKAARLPDVNNHLLQWLT